MFVLFFVLALAPQYATSLAVVSINGQATVSAPKASHAHKGSSKHSHRASQQLSAAALEGEIAAEWAEDIVKAFWNETLQFTVAQTNTDILGNPTNAPKLPDFKYLTYPADGDQFQPIHQGALEPFVSYHLSKDMQECCKAGGHFLDVGGNFGWYTLLGAATGCHAHAVEPVPWYAALIRKQKALNPSLASRINVHEGFVLGSEDGKMVEMKVPISTAQGLGKAGVDGMNTGGQGLPLKRPTKTVDSLIQSLNLPPTEKWCGMKVDVEGYEPNVFQGATDFLKKQPLAIAIEVSPGVTASRDPANIEIIDMLNRIVNSGYTAHFLDWELIKNGELSRMAEPFDAKVSGKNGDLGAKTMTDMNELVETCQKWYNCMVYFSRKEPMM